MGGAANPFANFGKNLKTFLGGGPAPTVPDMPAEIPKPPDQSDEAIQNSKLMERRRQIGLMGAQSTWLTGARGDTSPAQIGYKTLLGE